MPRFSATSSVETLIALGGNLPSVAGPPEATLRAALGWLDAPGCRVVAVSRFYRTPCFPAGAGPDYVNAAAVLDISEPPEAIMARLHDVEKRFDRVRAQRWGSRTLDLDLLAAGQRVHPDRDTFDTWRALPPGAQAQSVPGRLILPHPRMQDRGFVLIPLCDVAPDWRHPVLGLTVRQMADALPEAARAGIRPL